MADQTIMTTTSHLIHCYGCGVAVPDEDGPTHRYTGASPGFWAIHGHVLARSASGPMRGDDRLPAINFTGLGDLRVCRRWMPAGCCG